MPIEGITPATPATPATPNAQHTSDGDGQNTGATPATPNADTQAAQNQSEAQKTFTQDEVNRMIANRVKSGIKAELKKLGGDGENGGVTLEHLQRQLTEERTARQTLEARQNVREFISDAKNQLNVRPENLSAIEELVNARLTFEDGTPTNLKESIQAVKSIAPALFANQPSSINAAEGRTAATGPVNMNDFIRLAHAKRA